MAPDFAILLGRGLVASTFGAWLAPAHGSSTSASDACAVRVFAYGSPPPRQLPGCGLLEPLPLSSAAAPA